MRWLLHVVDEFNTVYWVWPARSTSNATLESFKRYLLEAVPVIDERGLELLS
ncbi:hypothetical protein ACP9OK_15890 [Pseudomonas sp. B11]